MNAKVTSYCVFAHSPLILIFANLIRKWPKNPREPSDPVQPCTLDWSPVAAPRTYEGHHDTFEKPMMRPGHQLILKDSAPVLVVSLSHTAVLMTHQSSKPSVCGLMEAWGHLSPGSLDSEFWHPTAYPDFPKDNLKQQGSGLPSWRPLYLTGDAASKSRILVIPSGLYNRNLIQPHEQPVALFHNEKHCKFRGARPLAYDRCHLFLN